MTYRIVRRFYRGNAPQVIETGLSLDEAREHCNDVESSSSSCTSPAGRARLLSMGEWFDSFEREEDDADVAL